MPSSWGGSWGSSWGNSWGTLEEPEPTTAYPIGLLLALTQITENGPGPEPEPEPEPDAVVAAAPDRGFDAFFREFAIERARERRRREDDEILAIMAMETDLLAELIRRLKK